jgi:hypothetical protein
MECEILLCLEPKIDEAHYCKFKVTFLEESDYNIPKKSILQVIVRLLKAAAKPQF